MAYRTINITIALTFLEIIACIINPKAKIISLT